MTIAAPSATSSHERGPGDGPVVIGGMPRSGTSLMQGILGSHPDIALFPTRLPPWRRFCGPYRRRDLGRPEVGRRLVEDISADLGGEGRAISPRGMARHVDLRRPAGTWFVQFRAGEDPDRCGCARRAITLSRGDRRQVAVWMIQEAGWRVLRSTGLREAVARALGWPESPR